MKGIFKRKSEALILLGVLFCANCAGEIWQDITFMQDGQITDTNHFVQVFVYDTPPNTTHLAISGGQIGALFTYNNSTTAISGGTFSSQYYQYHPENNDGDNLFLLPPEASVNAYDQSSVMYNGGSLGTIKCTDYSNLTVNGGACSIKALKYATVSIAGGVIGEITTIDPLWDIWQETNSQFYLTGGTFISTVLLTGNNQMHIFGCGFTYDPNGIINIKGLDQRVGILSGTWQNGTPFEINFGYLRGVSSYNHVVLHEIPEPSIVLLFVFSFIFVRLKKSS
jgi:hypothetical protein